MTSSVFTNVLNGSQPPVTTNTSSPSGTPTTAGGMESEFLTLLTTQLQNQDPTNPADTNQITQEMAMLGQVEQQTNTNTLLQQMITLLGAGQATNAVGYIGKNVDVASSGTSPAQLELTNSQATLVYSLPPGVANATVTITNAAGQTIYSGPGTTAVGRNEAMWQGNNTSGATVPDGVYNFTVTATDSSGKALTATTYTTGIVQAVDNQNGTTMLDLGNGLLVPLSGVAAAYNQGSNPSNS